jgi:hypothetical protein
MVVVKGINNKLINQFFYGQKIDLLIYYWFY